MPVDGLSSPVLPPSASLDLSAPPSQTAQRLALLADQARGDSPAANADLRRGTQMLEATFVAWLLREMRQTVPQSGLLPKGPADETYDQLYDDALSRSIANGHGIGLAPLIEAKLRSGAAARAPAGGAGTAPQSSGPIPIGGTR